MTETEYKEAIQKAKDKFARIIGSAQSTAAADAALYSLRGDIDRIDARYAAALAKVAE